jgi:tRNA pseudouridine38-40 synthase
MQNLKLTLEYDGTDYHGWQVQPGLPTIQGTLEETIKRVSGEEVRVTGAGRTDAGVHAVGQVANFSTGKGLQANSWQRALNALLPPDIVVRRVEETSEDFDARRSAKSKTYRYSILNRPSPSALDRRYLLHVPNPLDLAAMAEAAAHLLGEHDFSAFRAADGDAVTSARRVYEARLATEGERMHFFITADAFLMHMVRIIVGTLLDVGAGKITPAGFREILKSRDRGRAGKTAPPHGLCLVNVQY